MDSSQTDDRAAAAPVSPMRIGLLLVTAWLLPGSGHLALGRQRRALAFFLIVYSTLALGVVLDGELYRVIGTPLATLATLTTAAVGGVYFVLRFFLHYTGDITSGGYEYGKAFILTAGLMNILLLLDVWDIARGDKE